jgi:hypothetical protein
MTVFGHGNETFEERQSKAINLAEELFKEWAKANHISVYRLGFDEKGERLPQWHFNLLPEVIRKLPDFVAIGRERRIVEVKGTPRLKKVDYDLLDQRVSWFSTPESPLWFAFCFRGQPPIWKTPEQVKALYQREQDQRFENDGVVYRRLRLESEVAI